MRKDLLALSEDDLVLLSNRGTVKRATRELDENEVTFTLTEDDAGNVNVEWSDNVTCKLPSNKALADGICTCPATTTCRHLIRSALAYQRQMGNSASVDRSASASADRSASASADRSAGVPPAFESRQDAGAPDQENGSPASSRHSGGAGLQPSAETDTPVADSIVNEAEPPPYIPTSANIEPWDPGTISDETLAKYIKAPILAKAKKLFDDGQVIELVKASKPFARFHTLSTTVKFLVPDDPRYTHCDCIDKAPCMHVPLAVWAFRMLPRSAGIVATNKTAPKIPTELLDTVEDMLIEFVGIGLASLNEAFVARMKRLETACRDDGLIWPAEIIADLIEERQRYQQRDARFNARHIVDLIGELAARCDVIRNNPPSVPQIFVRGSASDRATDLAPSRMIGMGCNVEIEKNTTRLISHFQDVDSGNILVVDREFVESEDRIGEAKPFWQLAQAPVSKGVSLGAMGSGQLITKGGKLTPARRFIPGRSALSLNHQMFNWEKLRTPVYNETFAETRACMMAQPPSYLGPRQVGRNFHVCPISEVEGATFSTVEQAVVAYVYDSLGERALLYCPYMSRADDGIEMLLQKLRNPDVAALRFVAGYLKRRSSMLVIQPVSTVFEENGRRVMVQPFIDKLSAGSKTLANIPTGVKTHQDHPIRAFPMELTDLLGDLILSGLERADTSTVTRWQRLQQDGVSLGFIGMLEPVDSLIALLSAKSRQLRWDWQEAARRTLDVAVLSRVAHEEEIEINVEVCA